MGNEALTAMTALAAGAVSCAGTRVLVTVLRRAAVLDRPNERSSHAIPTPRGGGIAVVGAILAAWLALVAAGMASPLVLTVIGGALLLAIVSWVDDLRGLPAAFRFLAQVAAVLVGLDALAPLGPVFQGWLPMWADRLPAALLWVWFVNLFNFMDGIDGIDASEAAAIALGLVLFAALGAGSDLGLAAIILAAAVGFLVWNWAPARIFLGDVGSIPIGYLLGFLLLSAAARGHWKIALILPAYFLADATITLLRRLVRGEKVWQAHREHFYQRAVQRGLGHAAVVRRVIAVDLVLIACGLAAESGWTIIGLGVAAATVVVLLINLAYTGRPSAP